MYSKVGASPETMALEELDNILSKFLAKVKKGNGDDY